VVLRVQKQEQVRAMCEAFDEEFPNDSEIRYVPRKKIGTLRMHAAKAWADKGNDYFADEEWMVTISKCVCWNTTVACFFVKIILTELGRTVVHL